MNPADFARVTSGMLSGAYKSLDKVIIMKDIYEREGCIIIPEELREYLDMKDDCIDGKEREFIMKSVDKALEEMEGIEMLMKMAQEHSFIY